MTILCVLSIRKLELLLWSSPYSRRTARKIMRYKAVYPTLTTGVEDSGVYHLFDINGDEARFWEFPT